MNLNLVLILILCTALLALLFRHDRIPIRHRWRRRQAREMCEQLRGRDRDQPVALHYARFRAMDPLAFEELLLEAFERRGHRVIRNCRYTGDGGVDGEVIIDGIRFLIQAKRYKDAIRPEHVWDFAQLCATRRQRGLFIHTGRTGGMSRAVVDGATGIQIVSGQKLLALLTGAPFLPDLCEPRRPRETIAFRRTSS
ncbi:restriction endonuclease [Sphingobium sp. GW456-12-10-14-TSB1]|jgi:restriction system protein|uniref:restriction endonuclease n=2 Tax=Alphaproteobacteria TaxID=28211 RepID=UPI00065CAFB0|nr:MULTISPECIES: restriction endonuclease [Sphingomonadaceae]OUC54427.1 restriction endonuclease [Sphingobium sp. GW456-12-10-14-TSB1]